jgi:hypothetical protein
MQGRSGKATDPIHGIGWHWQSWLNYVKALACDEVEQVRVELQSTRGWMIGRRFGYLTENF